MRLARVFLALFVLFPAFAVMSGTPQPAQAAASLAIAPVSWGVVGLDSNKVTDGPDTFMIGAVVTNTGTLTATNLTATWTWDTTNANINLDPTSSNPITSTDLLPGQSVYFYFNIKVTRISAAYNTARRYHISVSATGFSTVSTPTPREVFVEHLVSQNRNSVHSITGPTTVYVGGVYTYTLNAGTATNGYEQLVAQINLTNVIFRLLNVQSQYVVPSSTINPSDYADACGWDAVPTSPTYRSCSGTGKAGGDPIVVTYTVQIMNTGTATLGGLVYDYSGSSYHYNSDLNALTLTVNALPTAAQVSNAAAAPSPGGGVDLQWTSATEMDNAGFNVLRAATPGGPFAPVNPRLIAAFGNTAGGGLYRFHDPTGAGGNWYQIESLDSQDATTRTAPFRVAKTLPALAVPPDRQQAALAATAQAKANARAVAALPHPPLTTTPYKLLISQSGVARISYEQLQAAGVPLQGVDPATLALSVGSAANRTAVPITLHVATPGVFAPGDSFDFIAMAAPSPYGDARAYYLTAGTAPGKQMPHAGSAFATPPYPTSFQSTLHLEENHIYWQQAANHQPAQATGPWYWTYALDSADASATLLVPDIDATQPAAVQVAIQGFLSDPHVNPDHHAAFYLNNVYLGEQRWNGSDGQQVQLAVPAGVLQSGGNTLRVHLVADTGAEHDGVVVNSADLTYTRFYRAAGDALSFAVPAGTSVVVPGFSGPAVLYDVTRPEAPVALAAGTVDGSLQAYVPGQGQRQLLAAGPGGVVAPDSILPMSSLNLAKGGADYLVLAADSLLEAGGQLAAFHAGAGLRTSVVPVSAIYDQFGAGVPGATAITAFLRYTQNHWSPAPHYVALLGSASYDPHNYLGLGDSDLLPTGYVTTPSTGRTASDASLALPSPAAQAAALPFVALGRLPARTPAEASALIAKLIAYSSTAHQWSTQAALVADQADAGSFDIASQQLARVLGPLTLTPINESQYGAGTRDQIVNTVDAGSALLNYYGHGSVTYWSADAFFDTQAVNTLINNPGRETFVTAMTCYSGDYDYAPARGLVDALVLKPQGGAIGGIGGTGISYAAGQHQLNQAFYQGVLDGARVGDALLRAYAATGDPEVAIQFHLIGDPALRVDLGQ